MKTIELSGRYTVGAVLYIRPGTPREAEAWEEEAPVTPAWETVGRRERATMTADQVALLTTVKVVSVRAATEAAQARAASSEGSVGVRETSICEVVEAPTPAAPKSGGGSFTDPEGITYTRKG